MTMISFTVPAVPVAQPRQRQTVIAGHVHGYTPTRHPVNSFKAACALAARTAYQGPPLEGPVRLNVVFVLPRPRAMIWKQKPMPRTPHCHAPDGENLLKALQDSLSGTIYKDDGQIYTCRFSKWIAAGSEQPHVEVEIHAE